MGMEKQFMCRFKGCGDARSGRLYTAHHMVAHYMKRHHDIGEGQRQLRLQKAALTRNLAESLGQLDPANQIADARADGAPVEHVADELNPPNGEQEVHEVRGIVGDVVVNEGTAQFLEARINRLRSEAGIIQGKLAALELEMGIIADELTRTLAAKAAWDTAVGPQSDPKDSIGE